MNHLWKTYLHHLLRLCLGAIFLLTPAGCGGGQEKTQPVPEPTGPSASQIVLPTPGPTDLETPAVELIESTAVPLNLKEFHPNLEKGAAFSYDDHLWSVALVGSGPRLTHDQIEDCYIVDPLYSDTGYVRPLAPERVYLSGVNWNVTNGIYYQYEEGQIELELGSPAAHQDPACRTDQEAVLNTLVIEGQALATEAPFPTFTPLPEYYCPQAPEPRLEEGQEAISLVEVLLRSTPEKSTDNVIRTVSAGVRFHLEEGPLCGEFPGGAYVYWRVTIVRTGEEGWVAEAGFDRYYLKEYEAPQ